MIIAMTLFTIALVALVLCWATIILFEKRVRTELKFLRFGQKLVMDSAAKATTATEFLKEMRRGNDDAVQVIDIIDCHTCGCMVKKQNAVAGPDVIEEERRGRVIGCCEQWVRVGTPEDPYYVATGHKRLVNDWYCKRCAPGKAKQARSGKV